MGTCFTCVEELERFVMTELATVRHDTYHSRTSNSVYVTFLDERIGELTIRDHRAKTSRIRWNIIYGYRGKKRKVNNFGEERFFYSELTILQFLDDFGRVLDSLRQRCNTDRRRINPWA